MAAANGFVQLTHAAICMYVAQMWDDVDTATTRLCAFGWGVQESRLE